MFSNTLNMTHWCFALKMLVESYRGVKGVERVYARGGHNAMKSKMSRVEYWMLFYYHL